MRTESVNGGVASPWRLLEMLSDRFGVFEAIAMASIELAPHVSEDELPMDLLVADAVLEFGMTYGRLPKRRRSGYRRNAPLRLRSVSFL
jgi:hypothetical protein